MVSAKFQLENQEKLEKANHLIKEKNFGQAYVILSEVMKNDPKNQELKKKYEFYRLMDIGTMKMNENKYEEAKQYFLEADKVFPESTEEQDFLIEIESAYL